MIGEIFAGISRVVASVLQNRPTGATVETELNRQFGDLEWSITNYRDEEVKLSVQSISVRPKYFDRKVQRGIREAEGDHLFTHTEDDDRSNTLGEKLSASFRNEWVTKVQIQIKGGDAESIRPSGMSLAHVIAQEAIYFDGYVNEREYFPGIPPLRVKPTHELQNDKLEMKARYDGEIGAYAERLTEGIEFLDYIQDEMETLALRYLLDLHYGRDSKAWGDPERAAMVAEYAFGGSISLETLDDRIQIIKAELESSDGTSDDVFTD